MKKEIIYQIPSIYRDNFRVTGYRFGEGKHAACIVGNSRGNEIQQLYVCSQMVKCLKALERAGKIREGNEILVIPSINPYSMNIQKRFWQTDNTDINRMFPGYKEGETTQRIAAGVFEAIHDYEYGMQFTSFYMPGNFIPHVRVMDTGLQDVELAKKFGLPYVVRRKVRPYDTTTLNYNWQIWESQAFSVYTTSTTAIDQASAIQAVRGILNFLDCMGVVDHKSHHGYISEVVDDVDMVSVRTKTSGLFECDVEIFQEVQMGQVLARVIDPYEGEVLEEIKSPVEGIVFFAHNEPLTYSHTAVFKLIQ